jgi:anti-sigma factor RsiW
MSECRSVEPLAAAYVDGELSAADRAAVDQHVDVCAACRSRLDAERSVRTLCGERRAALRADRAPDALRARCGGLARADGPAVRARPRLSVLPRALGGPAWGARLVPLALAATLVLAVAGALLYQITSSSSRVMAAELTADHVKCFAMNALLGTHQTPELVERSLAAGFDWPVQLPKQPEQAGLELVGSRPCLYGEGRVAHIMYRHEGRPVSLYMLPKTSRSDAVVQVLGHEAAVWSVGDRTFVLIAREEAPELERLVAFVQTSVR